MATAKKRKRKSRAQIEHERYEKKIALEMVEREQELEVRERERRAREREMANQVEHRLERMRIDHLASQALAAELIRQRPFVLPEPGWTAKQFLEEDDSPLVEVIEGLHYVGNNTLLVAEFKAGKTTLEINLAAALADGGKFLDQFQTNLHGRIAFLNYEMDDRQFRTWLRQAEVENIDRIVPLNLRGWRLPFWNEEEMLRLAEWLLANEVEFIIMDPAARAWRGLVESESDNVQLGEFFGSLDELKRLANVPNLLISAHKPRGSEDRARGGGEIEAWPDGNWYVKKDKGGVRSLRAEGRDVLLKDTVLDFDEDTHHLSAAGSLDEVVMEMDVITVVSTVNAHGEFPSVSTLQGAMKGMGSDRKAAAINEAVRRGLVIEEDGHGSRIFRAAK